MTCRHTLLFAACLALAIRAQAGPCLVCDPGTGPVTLGWWHDRAVSPAGRTARAPRIDVQSPGVSFVAAVVWEDRTQGDGDIWLATTLDGCSWRTGAVTSGPDDDRLPDVAVAAASDFLAVVFLRGGAILAAASSDGGRTFSTPERIHPTATALPASPPRIAAITTAGKVHLHVVWGDGAALEYGKSLDGGAPGSWVAAPALSTGFTGFDRWRSPDVAADTRSLDPAQFSAVTIVASGTAPGRTVAEIFAVRSSDSGATFYGDPVDPASRNVPQLVSDPRPDDPALAATAPQLDASDDGSGMFYNWSLAGWTDARAGSARAVLDARAEEGATPTLIAPWNNPPASTDVDLGPPPAAIAAVSVLPNPLNRPPVPEVHAYSFDEATPGARDVAAVRGFLDPNVRPTMRPFCGPYRLSGLFPPRPSGEVADRSFSADEDLSFAWVAWEDSRDGLPRIYFKRTDSNTEPPFSIRAAPAPCATTESRLDLTWTSPLNPPNCDIDHYRVDYGLSPGNYTSSANLNGPGPVGALVAGTTYYLRVTTVDEACNEASGIEVSARAPDCAAAPRCPNPVGNTLLAVRTQANDVDMSFAAPSADLSHDLATSFDVHRSRTSGGSGYSLLANAPATNYRDALAALPGPSDRHFYRIVARNACGTSGDEP